MSLPSSGAIGLRAIQLEFGAPLRTPLSEFVAGGTYVPDLPSGFPGGDIPTSLPLALTDFYNAGTHDDLIAEQNLELENLLNPCEVHVINEANGGFYVTANVDGDALTSDSRFIVDMRFRMGPDSVDVPIPATSWSLRTNYIGIGLCAVNPVGASPAVVAANFTGWIFEYRNIDSSNNVLAAWGREVSQNIEQDAQVFSGAGYSSSVKPSKTDYTTVRVQRVSASNGEAEWELRLYSGRDTWATLWNSATHTTPNTIGLDGNTDGWLVILNSDTGTGENQELDIDVIKACYGYGTTPWS